MALAIRCFGKVQGVFYRASTKSEAENLNLTGWVKNEPEGTVLVHAEGDDESLRKLAKWCEEGPQFAEVKLVEAWEQPDEGFDSFEIRQS